eukprot:snap_masked-scaffold_4-processed-gene-7.47-mRNA-1 protein AED:1.00 eAED:1.00 QI:0/-1/0/0/-1/1/1/0/137
MASVSEATDEDPLDVSRKHLRDILQTNEHNKKEKEIEEKTRFHLRFPVLEKRGFSSANLPALHLSKLDTDRPEIIIGSFLFVGRIVKKQFTELTFINHDEEPVPVSLEIVFDEDPTFLEKDEYQLYAMNLKKRDIVD